MNPKVEHARIALIPTTPSNPLWKQSTIEETYGNNAVNFAESFKNKLARST